MGRGHPLGRRRGCGPSLHSVTEVLRQRMVQRVRYLIVLGHVVVEGFHVIVVSQVVMHLLRAR